MNKKILSITAFLLAAGAAQAQSCPHRGELDAAYCDANQDLVADTPARTIHPKTLMVGISSVEGPDVAFKTYSPLTEHLSGCLKQEVLLYPPVGEANVLEALRTDRIHIAQFGTGAMTYAVNFAGAVPFAGKGAAAEHKREAYTLLLIVRADSPFRKPTDLAGRKIAHTSATSNSGNLAPRALFPDLGLTPDKDYKVEFSGKHDKSILGVQYGLYDAAAVASDVFQRMVMKGEIKANQFRVIYESDTFPPDAFAMSHHLDPKLAAQIRQCFLNFRFPAAMSRQLEGNDRFFPVDYKQDWKLVRLISKASGVKMDHAGYEAYVNPQRKH